MQDRIRDCSCNGGNNRAKRATRFMNLGKAIEDSMRTTISHPNLYIFTVKDPFSFAEWVKTSITANLCALLIDYVPTSQVRWPVISVIII